MLDLKPGSVFKKLNMNGLGRLSNDFPLQTNFETQTMFTPKIGAHGSDANLYRYSYVADDATKLISNEEPFPMAIRGIRWSRNHCQVLLEQAPTRQTILWYPGSAGTSSKNDPIAHSLPFPWTQFLITLDVQVQADKKSAPLIGSVVLSDMKFSTHAMTAGFRKNVKLYRVPLPNVYGDGHMCFQKFFKAKEKPTFVKAIEEFMAAFYGSTFNMDLGTEWNLFAKTKFASSGSRATGANFESIFGQWSKYEVEDMVDPEKIPFAEVDTEEYWKDAPIFNVEMPPEIYSAGYVRNHSIKGTARHTEKVRTSTLNLVDPKTGKSVKALMKQHNAAANALEAAVMIDSLVSSIFNKHRLTARNGLDHFVMHQKIHSNTAAGATEETKKLGKEIKTVLSFGFGSNTDTIRVKKLATKGHLKSVPTIVQEFVTDLGTSPPYSFDLARDRFIESMRSLRRETFTGGTPLPPGLRFWDPHKKVMVFERPPAIRSVSFYPANKDQATQNSSEERETYKLFIPWTQYWVSYNSKMVIQSIHATCSSVPMGHQDWRVGILPLPNMYFDSKVCTPNVIDAGNSISDMVIHAYNAVWSSNYNMDLQDATMLFVDGLDRDMVTRRKNYTDEQVKLGQELIRAFRNGSYSQFFQVWQAHTNPHDLLKMLTCVEPKSDFADFEVVEGESNHENVCECGSSDYEEGDEDYYECECSFEDEIVRKALPLTMRSMILASLSQSQIGWFSNKLTVLDNSIFSAYDAILLHGQAYQQKMTY